VGIGVASPNYPLSFPNLLGDKISLWDDGNGANYGFGIQGDELQVHTDTTSADIVFGSGSSASLTETMRIKGRGSVGIGTNNPQATLDLNGNFAIGNGQSIVARNTNGTVENFLVPRWIDSASYLTYGTGGFVIRNDENVLTMFMRDNGNVGIGTNNPQTALHVVGNILATGTITGSSDRNVKENFAPVDTSAILDKVAALPISTWNYIADKDVRHVGPMAQDFYAAFNVGMDDKHISMVDADGVSLAAIQALNEKVEAENQKLETENAELKARLEKLEELINARKRDGQ
jgi:hypothetical protein